MPKYRAIFYREVEDEASNQPSRTEVIDAASNEEASETASSLMRDDEKLVNVDPL